VNGLPENIAFRLGASGWQPLPALTSPYFATRVNAFALHDIGGGVHVYALGKHAFGLSARLVNNAWYAGPESQLGSGFFGEAFVGRSFDDGHGPALYVGDLRYVGASTSVLQPDPQGAIRAMTQIFDDGN